MLHTIWTDIHDALTHTRLENMYACMHVYVFNMWVMCVLYRYTTIYKRRRYDDNQKTQLAAGECKN